jgi:hypothetical protein
VVAVLKQMYEARDSEFAFPDGKPNRPLNNMALLALLDRMHSSESSDRGAAGRGRRSFNEKWKDKLSSTFAVQKSIDDRHAAA